VFGYSSGVIGLQLFLNKKFDASKWSVKKYEEDPGSVRHLIWFGMACSFCHVTFNPDKPPQSRQPKWENSARRPAITISARACCSAMPCRRIRLPTISVLSSRAGRSRNIAFPSDFINGPIVINSIYLLGERLKLTVPEKITPAQRDLIKSMYAHVGLKDDDPGGALGGTEAEPTLKVPHILVDGSDSMSILMASTRVYVNEGSAHDLWVSTTWALNPFDIKESIARNFKPANRTIGTARKDQNSLDGDREGMPRTWQPSLTT
jgi:hypothetical protein